MAMSQNHVQKLLAMHNSTQKTTALLSTCFCDVLHFGESKDFYAKLHKHSGVLSQTQVPVFELVNQGLHPCSIDARLCNGVE